MAYGPMSHGLMYIDYGHESDYSIVSGFYGPCAVLAWLLTSVQNVLSYRKEEELDSVGFTAIFAYASVAAMDAILHIFRGEYDAQYDAAFAVCIYMTILVTLCLD
jgi:hypothetical protein